MGVMDGGEIKLVENKVIVIRVLATFIKITKKIKVVRGEKALIEEERLIARSSIKNSNYICIREKLRKIHFETLNGHGAKVWRG